MGKRELAGIIALAGNLDLTILQLKSKHLLWEVEQVGILVTGKSEEKSFSLNEFHEFPL